MTQRPGTTPRSSNRISLGTPILPAIGAELVRRESKRVRFVADNQPVRLLVIAISLLTATGAAATPGSGTWRRQTLLGENATYFFRYVTISEYPPSYYSHRRMLRLEKVSKSDLRVVEEIPLRDVTYSEDVMTGVRTEKSKALPAFDFSEYLTRNAVYLPFSEDAIRTFTIDSAGVWEVFEDGRVQLAGRSDLLRQIPDLGEEPRVVGVETTDYEPAKGSKAFIYLRIWSNTGANDDDWSEDLLLVNQNVFQ